MLSAEFCCGKLTACCTSKTINADFFGTSVGGGSSYDEVGAAEPPSRCTHTSGANTPIRTVALA
eukprot:4516959-Amphidinium_carterae.1